MVDDPPKIAGRYTDKGGYRNWFGIYPREDDENYISIKFLVEKGYMIKSGNTEWGNEEVYSVTDIGKNN